MKKPLFTFFILLLFFIPVFQIKASTPIKILLVPGHDDEVWGSQYGNVKEADMNLALAKKIHDILKKDKRFKVYISRDKKGYTKKFSDYFSKNQEAILAFRENAKAQTKSKVARGDFIVKTSPPHNTATEDMAVRLYGFNKWAGDNKMDAVIHIHFDDYIRPDKWTIGKYEGFTVYFPDAELPNAELSEQLAADIFAQLDKKYTGSNFPPEKGGLAADQLLIALGSNSTLLPSVHSVLVEYGYIYEKKFRKKSTQEAAYKSMASLTVKGIQEYFFPQ